MYTANKKQRKYRLIWRFSLFVLVVLGVGGAIVWFVFFRNSDNQSTNFARAGSEVASVQASEQEFKNELFKFNLPAGWEAQGMKNPVSDEKYYSFQNMVKGYDNRWLRVYVDVFPANFPINKLMPVSVVDNRVVPGILSDDCTSFTGAPLDKNAKQTAAQWTAKWQGIAFTCDMAKPQNLVGTANADEGMGTTLASLNGTKHKYLFVYIDHNVAPDYKIFTDALKSFQTL